MPVESKAQSREMYYLYEQGKITKAQLDDWTKGVKTKGLPERVHPKPKKK